MAWVPRHQPGQLTDLSDLDKADTGLFLASEVIIPTSSTTDAFVIGTTGALTGGIPCTVNDVARFILCSTTITA